MPTLFSSIIMGDSARFPILRFWSPILVPEGMKKLISELQEFQKNYPDYKQGKLPEGMEADIKRMEEVSARIPAAMTKVGQYLMDARVQEAMTQMGNEMANLNQ